MKNILFVLLALMAYTTSAQDKTTLQKHFEAYYQQMRTQGDINGVINAMTHLNILSPSEERKDTLAYLYLNNNQHLQALNTIGFETNASDSDMAVNIKALSLKSLNQPKRALEQFEILFSRQPTAYIAYELADLKIQTGDNEGASADIDYGILNATDEMKHAFYERQQPYEVSLKAAFYHLKGLVQYNMNKDNIDMAIATIDEALAIDPGFNLASLSKQALETRKNEEGQEK
jgi:tetratricopeptide (TPR) repeat protein